MEHADVGMFEVRDRLRFAFDTLLPIAEHGCLRRQDLDRHRALEARVAGFVHFAHATGAGELENFVRTETGAWLHRHVGGWRANYTGLPQVARCLSAGAVEIGDGA